MSRTEYSAASVISQYESDLSAWENQLHELEEQAKGLSLDSLADQKELLETSRTIAPDITDMYEQVKESREEAKDLQTKLEYVLDNPKMRYTSIPESLNKQEQMNERINELDETFYMTEERQEYISYTLGEELGISLEGYAEQEGVRGHLDTFLQKTGGELYVKKLQKKISEDPESAFIAGLIAGGAGILAAGYALDKLDRRE